jgi:hypothetical protein
VVTIPSRQGDHAILMPRSGPRESNCLQRSVLASVEEKLRKETILFPCSFWRTFPAEQCSPRLRPILNSVHQVRALAPAATRRSAYGRKH